MRKLFCFSMLFLLLLVAQGHAEVTLHLKTESVSPGQTVVFEVSGASGEVMYDIYQNGQLLVRSEFTQEKTGAYVPAGSGTYRVKVTERTTGSSAEKLFQVTGPLSVSMEASEKAVTLGETIAYSASAAGGAAPYSYTFSVLNGNTRIYAWQTADGTFSYSPEDEGQYQVECTVKDSQNASASASVSLSVSSLKQEISVEADSRGPFSLCGGVRTYTVHSTGFWTVSCDSDFVSLSRSCGRNGETLCAVVAPGTEKAERAILTFTCGDSVTTQEIRRLTDDGIEKEIHFSPVNTRITIDGASLSVWDNALGSREFPVISTSSWNGRTSQEWIHYSTTADGNLTVTVDEPARLSRAGYVYIFNDESGAYLGIFQSGTAAGPVIDQVILSENAPEESPDTLAAEVHTRDDADRILVYSGNGTAPLAVSSPEDQLSPGIWRVTFPSQPAGSLLFAAEKAGITGSWVEKEIVKTVAAAIDPAFACETAEAFFSDEETLTITVRVTPSVRNIRLVNSLNVMTGNLSISAASYVDRYIDENNHGRAVDWTFSVSVGSAPSFLQIDDSRIPVVISYPVEQLPKYNQFDGRWKKVAYRHSDLQTSGCAIFTLANALSCLGITGDGTTPAELAEAYSFCLVEGGTLNSTLIGNASKAFGFRTRFDLYEDLEQVLGFFKQGAVFSFSVVKGHIALADSITADGSMVHVTDSALSATFSRIGDAGIYIQNEDGSFARVTSPSQIPDAVYYIETNAWSGGDYYLPSDYVLSRGLRLILKK